MIDDRRLLDAREIDIEASVATIADEFRIGFSLLARIERAAATVFGSARVAEHDPAYAAARSIGRGLSAHGWATITGGGPGVMEAANRGAQESGGLSVGLGISLPHEQRLNPYLDLAYTFTHFYARKVCFVKPADGFLVLPGGFGTLDELFEAVTLIQTEKVAALPVVLIGSGHWAELLDWLRSELLGHGLIASRDIDLLQVTDDPEEAVEIVVRLAEERRASD